MNSVSPLVTFLGYCGDVVGKT